MASTARCSVSAASLTRTSSRAPLFDIGGRTDFPPAEEFTSKPFAPDARALFCSCNTSEWAKRFTGATGVPSTGVQGTTFYGKTEVSAGRLAPGDNPGTSVRWNFQKVGQDIKATGPTSLSQSHGTPFLRLVPARPAPGAPLYAPLR